MKNLLMVDKISMALSYKQYPTFGDYAYAHEYPENNETFDRFLKAKSIYTDLAKVFTYDELSDLFSVLHDNDI